MNDRRVSEVVRLRGHSKPTLVDDPLRGLGLLEGDLVTYTVVIDNEVRYVSGTIVHVEPDIVRVTTSAGVFKVPRRRILAVTRREEP